MTAAPPDAADRGGSKMLMPPRDSAGMLAIGLHASARGFSRSVVTASRLQPRIPMMLGHYLPSGCWGWV